MFETGSSGGRKLYFVDVNTRKNELLALDVEIREEQGKVKVGFFDTNRGRVLEGKMINQQEDGFVFRTEQGDEMTFRVATVKEFDVVWRRQIEGNVPSFRSDGELHRWYYEQFA